MVSATYLLYFLTLLITEVSFSKGQLTGDVNNGTTNNSTSTLQPTTNGATTSKTSTSSHNATSTPAPTDSCSNLKTCDTCVDSYKCYWCGQSKSCEKWPENRITPGSCSGNKWYWKQCTIPGYILIIVVPVLGVLILLTCGCCIYCKCCRVKSKNREKERIKQRRQDMKDRQEERRKERQTRTDMIRQKYGLLKSEDEEPLL